MLTGRRKIAAGRYPWSAPRQNDDKNSIRPGCHFRDGEFPSCRRRKGDSFHETAIQTATRNRSANRGHRCRFERALSLRTHAHASVHCVSVRPTCGRAIGVSFNWTNRKSIRQGGNYVVHETMSRYIPSNRGFISGQACRRHRRVLYNPRQPSDLCHRVIVRRGDEWAPVGDSGQITGMPRMTRIAVNLGGDRGTEIPDIRY